MKKLNNLLNKVGTDKALHFAFAGWAVSAVSPYGIVTMAVVFILVFILSIIKERCLDDYADFSDVVASFLGEIVALLLYIPADLILN